jgi:UDPglucose 6-dehydrogenase
VDGLSGKRAVGILGLTYKPDTDVVEEAVGILMAEALAARGIEVSVYDPAGMKAAERALAQSTGKIKFAKSAEECIRGSRVVVVTTPWRQFREISAEQWTEGATDRVVLDCWRALKHLANCEKLRYMELGRGPSEESCKIDALIEH